MNITQLQIRSILKELGCDVSYVGENAQRFPCPVHKGQDKSLIIKYHLSDVVGFVCTNKECNFKGTFLSLLSKSLNIPEKEAIQLFKSGSKFSDIIGYSISDDEIKNFLYRDQIQSQTKEYLTACRKQFVDHPELTNIRAGLSRTSLRLVPKEVGVLVTDEKILPEYLKFLTKKQYNNDSYTVFPYTFNGVITQIKLYGLNSKNIHTIPINTPDVGIFLENNILDSTHVVVVPDPKVACLLYGTWMTETTKIPPIVSSDTFIFPYSFYDVRFIFGLATKDSPLTLKHCLSIIKNEGNYCEITDSKQSVRIVDATQLNSWEITTEFLKKKILHNEIKTDNKYPIVYSNRIDVYSWTAKVIEDELKKGNQQIIKNLVYEYHLTEEQKLKLKEALKSRRINKDLNYILNITANEITCDETAPEKSMELGNGEIIYTSNNGISTVKNGKFINLCNFGINVNSKILTNSGDSLISMTIIPRDQRFEKLKILATEDDVKNHIKFNKLLNYSYAKIGQSPYVTAYKTPVTVRWWDIINKLCEGKPVYQEITKLGWSSTDNSIHFPNIEITETGEIKPQQKIFTIPEHITKQYNGVGINIEDDLSAFKTLLTNLNNEYLIAFMLGLMHAVHQIVQPIYESPYRTTQQHNLLKPKHLLYVDSEVMSWRLLINKLNLVVAEDEEASPAYNRNCLKGIQNYELLGTLPYIIHLPFLKRDDLQDIIDRSQINIIGCVDHFSASYIDGRNVTSFIYIPKDRKIERLVLSNRNIIKLKDQFPTFLSEYIKYIKTTKAVNLVSEHPSILAYKYACNMLKLQTNDKVEELVKSYFCEFAGTADDLFIAIRRYFPDRGRLYHNHLSIDYDDSFNKKLTFINCFKNVVIIDKSIVTKLAQLTNNKLSFNIKDLDKDLKNNNILSNNKYKISDDYWVIDYDMWKEKTSYIIKKDKRKKIKSYQYEKLNNELNEAQIVCQTNIGQ